MNFVSSTDKYSFVDIWLVLFSAFNPAARKNRSAEFRARLRCALGYLESRNNAGGSYVCHMEFSFVLHYLVCCFYCHYNRFIASEWERNVRVIWLMYQLQFRKYFVSFRCLDGCSITRAMRLTSYVTCIGIRVQLLPALLRHEQLNGTVNLLLCFINLMYSCFLKKLSFEETANIFWVRLWLVIIDISHTKLSEWDALQLHYVACWLPLSLIDQVEVSTGQFPYREWSSIFDQLMQVVQGDPPCLDVERDQFSPDFVDFVNTWWAV